MMNISKTLTNGHLHDHHQQRNQLERQVASLREAVGQRAAIADNLEVHFWLLLEIISIAGNISTHILPDKLLYIFAIADN